MKNILILLLAIGLVGCVSQHERQRLREMQWYRSFPANALHDDTLRFFIQCSDLGTNLTYPVLDDFVKTLFPNGTRPFFLELHKETDTPFYIINMRLSREKIWMRTNYNVPLTTYTVVSFKP